MQKFFCSHNERVMISKIFDFLMKNSNLNSAHLDSFLNILSDNLGLEADGIDEITVEEFEDEFLNYFKNNMQAKNTWAYIKQELVQNDCELWV